MGLRGLGQWIMKQATHKYKTLRATYYERRTKLEETGGGGLQAYRLKYPW